MYKYCKYCKNDVSNAWTLHERHKNIFMTQWHRNTISHEWSKRGHDK